MGHQTTNMVKSTRRALLHPEQPRRLARAPWCRLGAAKRFEMALRNAKGCWYSDALAPPIASDLVHLILGTPDLEVE